MLLSLSIKAVIIVEDEITHISDIDTLISNFLLLKNNIQIHLLSKLNKEIAKKLKDFYEKFDLENSSQQKALKANTIEKEYLETKKIESDYQQICKEFKKDIDSIRMTFLRFGVANIPTDFRDIIKIVNECEKIQLILMNNVSTTEVDLVKEELKKLTPNSRYLAIVDKVLEDTNSGIEFIQKDLDDFNNYNSLEMFSVILTSKFKESTIEKLEDIYIYEVSKSDTRYLQSIINVLILCAYVNVFKSIKTFYNEATNLSYELSKQNPKNILQLIERSRIEGISPLVALTNWFELAFKFNFESSMVEKFQDLYCSMNKFDNSVLREVKINPDISDQLFKMQTFEIFDKHVNKKMLPVANGDIFLIGDKYFILVGQSCDISLREPKNKRDSNIAELLETEPIKVSNPSKLKINIKSNKEIIDINHFDVVKNRNVIRINISEKDKISCDFRLLDICTYNKDGSATISKDKELDSSISNLISKNKIDYYKKMQIEINQAFKIKGKINNTLIPLDISIFSVKRKNSVTYFWNLKRVCRLKEPFITVVFNKHIERKRRTGINTIDNAPFLPVERMIYYGYPDDFTHKFKLIFNNLFNCKLKKEELLEKVEDEFNELIRTHFPNEIEFKKNSKQEYEIEENDDHFTLKIPYYLETRKLFYKHKKITFKKIFNCREFNDTHIIYMDDNSEVDLPNGEINIQKQLSRGIHFRENGKSVKYENGFIKEIKKKQ